jgi:hypothetical protein
MWQGAATLLRLRRDRRRCRDRGPARRGNEQKTAATTWLAQVAAFLTILVALGSIAVDVWADNREHSSRQANASKQDYNQLQASLVSWEQAARDAYDASQSVYLRTGRWPAARDLGTHRPVYRAHAKVQSLQDGLSDSRLVRLLTAWHKDIKALCAARSRLAAEWAAKAMVHHRGQVNARIKKLRAEETKQLQMVR